MSKKNDESKNGLVPPDEIESLNVDDLDIEELERRIELASAMPDLPDGWICGADCGTACGANCPGLCGADCTSFNVCGANVCGSNSGCGANSGCFMAGTLIRMADGTYVPIEQIRVGDRVLSYDVKTSTFGEGQVEKSFIHQQIEGSFIINGNLRATATHPFFANGGWVNTSDLKVGDALLLEDDATVAADHKTAHVDSVRSLEWVPGANTVYNFAVSEKRNYFAGGVLVHNKEVPVE